MKKIFISLTIVSILLLIGCSQQMPNEPETGAELIKSANNKMEICCAVQDPFSGECQLNGIMIYTLRAIPVNSMISGNQTLLLTLDINAVLCDRLGMMHPCWQIKDYCEEELSVSEEGIKILEKDYTVSNRNDIRIRIAYLITLNSVSINSVTTVPAEKLL